MQGATGGSAARASRRAGVAASAAGLLLLVLAAWIDPAAAATAADERRPTLPINDFIRTIMVPRLSVYLYAPAPRDAEAVAEGFSVVFFSGELGWGPMMQNTAARLVAEGHGVIGIDSSDYFRRILSADDWAAELEILRSAVNRHAGRPPDAPVILAGFACGAEMVPYIVNRAGADAVRGALLVAADLEGSAVLQMHRGRPLPPGPEATFDVAEEMRRMPSLPVVLIQGVLDTQAAGPALYKAPRGPRRFVAIHEGDRYFREALEPYLDAVAEGLAWMESDPQHQPAGSHAGPPEGPKAGPHEGPPAGSH